MGWKSEILLDVSCTEADLTSAMLLQGEIERKLSLHLPIRKVFSSAEGTNAICFLPGAEGGDEDYVLEIGSKCVQLSSIGERGRLYAAATLCQLVRLCGNRLPGLEIKDSPFFANRGFMLDITRGRLPTIDYLKRLVDQMAQLKLNQLQLYVEANARIPGLEEAWSQTDPFIPQDVLELDRYCLLRGIELVPCIATFGHMYELLSTKSFGHLREMGDVGDPYTWYHRMRYHILNVSDPESFTFSTYILEQFLPNFSSRRVNICCDETFDLGKGKSTSMAEKMGYGEMYFSYVNRLAEYLQKRGYQVMIWGDIAQNHPDCLDGLNKDVTCLNWYYYYDAKESNFSIFKEHGLRQYVCPSVSGFGRLINAYDMSFANTRELAQLGRKYEADGLVTTEWGDMAI